MSNFRFFTTQVQGIFYSRINLNGNVMVVRFMFHRQTITSNRVITEVLQWIIFWWNMDTHLFGVEQNQSECYTTILNDSISL